MNSRKHTFTENNAIKSTTELEKCNQRDVAAMLYGNCFAGVGISIFASTVLVFGFKSPEIQEFKNMWWMGMFTLLLLRLIDAMRWHSQDFGKNYDGKKATYRYITGVWATALMWCMFSITTLRYVDGLQLTATLIIVSAMAGGGATILNAHKYTAIAYTFILLAPLSTGLVLIYDEYLYSLGMLGLAFCFVLIVTSRKSSDFTTEAIRAKNQNAVLVNEMEQGVEQRTKKIYELSNLDPLTGLFNRTAFIKHLNEQLEISATTDRSLALLFIDLDGFKRINDAIGHETGDQILTLTAARLQEYAPDNRLLCRWGGDEFIMVITDTSEPSALGDAAVIAQKISQAYVFDNNRLMLGATIGIAMFPDHAATGLDLIRLADTAMYFQKKQGQSPVGMFSQHLGAELRREQYLRDGLADAIAKRQLSTVYQPIVSSETGQIVAFEALLRWQFGRENIPPEEFIHIAEQYGLIRSIGAWVLNEACRVASTWDKKRDIAVCVNVSVNQLMDEDFIDIVDLALDTNQLPGKLLHIEITESVFASDKQIILNRVNSLQEREIHVSIDDFGTGYSSLSAMQDLAVDIVKIDKSFIDSIGSKGLAVISAVMHIAKSLGYRIVAEGVETEQQAQKLAGLGVHFQQGYYFAKPMIEGDVYNFIEQPSSPPRQISLVN